MRKTINFSFCHAEIWKTFNSLPFGNGNQKLNGKVYVLVSPLSVMIFGEPLKVISMVSPFAKRGLGLVLRY
jgi:hypothetical protein